MVSVWAIAWAWHLSWRTAAGGGPQCTFALADVLKAGLREAEAARARGLDTCPQAAFMQFHRIIGEQLGLADTEMVVCGMSLGHADPAAPENALITEREPVAGFSRFIE